MLGESLNRIMARSALKISRADGIFGTTACLKPASATEKVFSLSCKNTAKRVIILKLLSVALIPSFLLVFAGLSL